MVTIPEVVFGQFLGILQFLQENGKNVSEKLKRVNLFVFASNVA